MGSDTMLGNRLNAKLARWRRASGTVEAASPQSQAQRVSRHQSRCPVAGDRDASSGVTVPHSIWQQHAKCLRDGVARSWSQLIAGKPWIKAKERAGLVGHVRALEVTHGANGYAHKPPPHYSFAVPNTLIAS